MALRMRYGVAVARYFTTSTADNAMKMMPPLKSEDEIMQMTKMCVATSLKFGIEIGGC